MSRHHSIRQPLSLAVLGGSGEIASPAGGTMLEAGDNAPQFALPADDGSTVDLAALRGKKVVLYFYPKDDTPGCTKEACEFRDSWTAVQRAGAVVLGVSPDGIAAHERFKKKHRLPFQLLADTGHEVAAAYGAWGKKSMYGRLFSGMLRTTFIIDQDGRIAKVFQKVRPKGHAAQVLAALDEMDR